MSVAATASDSEIHLTLLIGGLFGPKLELESSSGSDTPVLEALLARSDRRNGDNRNDLEGVVFDLFNIQVDRDKDLPVAAITRVLDLGIIDSGWWLRADPVHLELDHDRLILADGAVLHVTQEEAERLVAEMMEVYADEGWVLRAAQPDRWYLKPPQEPSIKTTPLPTVVGRDVHPFLPQGEDSKAWHTFLNEVQILLHTASVNGERERRGKLSINSVWFWGGGRLPELRHVQWSKVWSAEPVSLALARLSGTPRAVPPANATGWLKHTDVPGQHLLVLDEGRRAVQYDDIESWQTFIQNLETNWAAPLLEAVQTKTVQSVTFYTESGQRFRFTPKGIKRWWRRRRPLSKYR